MEEKQKKQRVGRPESLTKYVWEKIELCIKSGTTIECACRNAKISRSTYYLWKEKAEVKKQKKYIDFFKMVEEATGYAELKLVLDIQKDTDWRSKAFILERRFPDWTKKTEVKVNDVSEPKKVIQYNVKDLSKEQLDEILNNDDDNEFE